MTRQRLVVLASGTGSLFSALVQAQDTLDADVVALVVDAPVPAIDIAEAAGIAVHVVSMTTDRSLWDSHMRATLDALVPDLVISAGFMKIIGPQVLHAYEGRIINTHPALLPLFPGAHAVRDALAAGVSETGATVHFVDAGVDTGPVIAQQVISVEPGDDEDSLHERIKTAERNMIVDVVRDVVSGKVRYDNGKAVTS